MRWIAVSPSTPGMRRSMSTTSGRLRTFLGAGLLAGQVELAVDQCVPDPAGVDRDLGVLDPPGGAGVLALHPDRAHAFLQVPDRPPGGVRSELR